MKITDITGTIKNGMWSYGPPLPNACIEEVTTMAADNESNFKITVASISGTYLETAAHRLPDQPGLIDIPVEKMVTEAVIFQLKDKGPGEAIELDELLALNIDVEKNKALLIRTGWDKMWDSPDFVAKSPYLTKEVMEWLLDKEPTIIGGDIPCFDSSKNPEGLVHMLFTKGVLILAPLVNLDKIKSAKVKLIALPAKVDKVCGFPCRAIAIED